MAKKARLFRAEIADGYGVQRHIYAASSKADVRNILNNVLSHHQNVLDIKHLGWFDFYARPDEYEAGTEFVARYEGSEIVFGSGHPSQAYLQQQFASQTAEVDAFNRAQYDDDQP